MAVSVSAALIVRDEEEVLGRCLDSLRDGVDEIVIVDTGSTDGTKEVARRYTDKIFDFAWRDDFAAARQYSFDQASSDWVMWVDADDVVRHADRIKPLVAAAPPEVAGYQWLYIYWWTSDGKPGTEFWRERCVRNDGSFRWVGCVHEVLVGEQSGQLVQNHDVVVEHHPTREHGTRKVNRNLRILQAEYKAKKGNLEPRMLFYLGREHADSGDTKQAIDVLRRYVKVSTWEDERFIAETQIANLHRLRGEYDQALGADLMALKTKPRWPDAYFGLAETYYYLQDWPKVIHWCDIGRAMPYPETTMFLNPRDYDFNWIIHYTNALYQVGELDAALEWTRRALALSPDDTWHKHNLEFFQKAWAQKRGDISPPE